MTLRPLHKHAREVTCDAPRPITKVWRAIDISLKTHSGNFWNCSRLVTSVQETYQLTRSYRVLRKCENVPMSYTETTVIDKMYSQKDTTGRVMLASIHNKTFCLSMSHLRLQKIRYRELYHYLLLHSQNEAMTYVQV